MAGGSGVLGITSQSFSELKLETADQLKILQFSLWRLETLSHWQRDNLFTELKFLAEALEIKVKDFLAPLFIAVSGSTSSFSVMDAMDLLGSDMTRARLRNGIDVLGGVSKKQMKSMEKAYRAINSGN